MTFWGDISKTINWKPGDVIALKGVKVGSYNGKSLNVSEENHFTVGYLGRERDLLQKWWASHSSKLSKIRCLTAEKTSFKPGLTTDDSTLIAEIHKNVGRDTSETKEAFYYVDCVVAHVMSKDNFVYNACTECRKKVYKDIASGDWRCDRCNQTYEAAIPTYMLLAKLSDCSDSMFVNFYSDQA